MKAAIFSLIILFLSTSVLMGQKKQELSKNPFKEAGYDVLMATSSKGEFAEFHDQTDIVEIGSVLYNTKTKEIVKILDKEDSTTVISSVTPAMSIDPLCEKYYWISPYAYCLNNPLKFIDPTGMAPIFDQDGNLLGTDADGWKGTSIVMNKDSYKEGMSNKDATKAGTKLNEYGKGIKISDESWTTVTDNGGSRMNPYVSNNSESTVYFKPEGNIGEYKNDGAYAIAAGTDLYMPVDGVKTENMGAREIFKVSDGGAITIDSKGNVTSDHTRSNALTIIPEGMPLLGGYKTGYRTYPDNSWLKLKNALPLPIFKDSPINMPSINKTIKTPKF